MGGDDIAFELEDLRLVQFEDGGVVGPVQPVGPRVQSGRQQHDLTDARFGDTAKVGVEVAGSGTLEVDEVLAELGVEHMLGAATVQYVRPRAADCATEHLRVRVDGERFGLLCLQCPRGGDQQRRRADARGDVPAVVVSTHSREGTRRS